MRCFLPLLSRQLIFEIWVFPGSVKVKQLSKVQKKKKTYNSKRNTDPAQHSGIPFNDSCTNANISHHTIVSKSGLLTSVPCSRPLTSLKVVTRPRLVTYLGFIGRMPKQNYRDKRRTKGERGDKKNHPPKQQWQRESHLTCQRQLDTHLI